MEIDILSELLKEMENVHYPSGPIFQNIERIKASMQSDELSNIYHLAESHVPGLRHKAIYRYDRSLQTESDNKHISLDKEYINFDCKDTDVKSGIAKMLQEIEEMPKEWTLVQLTPQYNPEECFNTEEGKLYTNSLYLTIFHCGKQQPQPYCVEIDAPIDKISGKLIEMRQEMESIIEDNKRSFKNLNTNEKMEFFNSHVDKHTYSKVRFVINNRLKNLVKDIQNIWIKEWRCLFAGRLMGEEENNVSAILENLLQSYQILSISEKVRCILKSLIKCSNHLKIIEIKQLIRYCFPEDKELCTNLSKSIHEITQQHNFAGRKRYPVILLVDEKLDALPWEMLDVLQDHPVSRMPSLHFTYALFKEHEDSIVDGVKIIADYQKGKYIINPGLDLKRMEARLHAFLKYWTPKWTGLVGVAPSNEQFEEMLLNSDIFSYNGHGNGSQFFSGDKIQKLRINSVVLLFGCGSVKYTNLGPQVEMYGSSQMYLIACSPCVVGMLWEVTDFDTDTISTDFWSLWLPNHSAIHWKHINKNKWELTGEIESMLNAEKPGGFDKNEPELLRALSKARKSARQYLTQSSCVARGIPVKIKC